MKPAKTFLDEVMYSGKYNYHYVMIYYWDNVTKSLKQTPFNRYINATKDSFGYTWLNEEGDEITIPYHRIMRITEIHHLSILELTKEEIIIWERTKKLEELKRGKFEKKKVRRC